MQLEETHRASRQRLAEPLGVSDAVYGKPEPPPFIAIGQDDYLCGVYALGMPPRGVHRCGGHGR
jgi:hypothetical protein